MSILSERIKKILSGEEEPHVELPPTSESELTTSSDDSSSSLASFASTLPPTIKAERAKGIDLTLDPSSWKSSYGSWSSIETFGMDVSSTPEGESAFKFVPPPSYPYSPPFSAPEIGMDALKAELEEHQRVLKTLNAIKNEYDRLRELYEEVRTDRDEIKMLLKELNFVWIRQVGECPFCGGWSAHESSCPVVETLGPEAHRKE